MPRLALPGGAAIMVITTLCRWVSSKGDRVFKPLEITAVSANPPAPEPKVTLPVRVGRELEDVRDAYLQNLRRILNTG